LTPDKAVLYELQAQCFLELDMVFEAVRAAEIAVQKEPSFGEGYQTLGRAQMNLGEVLNPSSTTPNHPRQNLA